MRGKKAAKARKLVFTEEHPFRDRKYFYKPDREGRRTTQVVADEFRQAYQKIKKLLKGKK